jgi:hypothetical protein
MRRGFEVEFTDLEGRERYDLLASNGKLEMEIDCKAPSGDVGRRIHKGRFRAFANDLMPSARQLTECGGGHLVHVTIPGNLHGDRKFERELVDEAVRVVQGKLGAKTKARAAGYPSGPLRWPVARLKERDQSLST